MVDKWFQTRQSGFQIPALNMTLIEKIAILFSPEVVATYSPSMMVPLNHSEPFTIHHKMSYLMTGINSWQYTSSGALILSCFQMH